MKDKAAISVKLIVITLENITSENNIYELVHLS